MIVCASAPQILDLRSFARSWMLILQDSNSRVVRQAPESGGQEISPGVPLLNNLDDADSTRAYGSSRQKKT
jgi:hypothetical protein